MDILNLKAPYGRLKGIRDLLAIYSTIPNHVGEDYNQIVDNVSDIVEEDCSPFLMSSDSFRNTGLKEGFLPSRVIQSKLFQLMSYLESTYNLGGEVIEVGSIYNSIKDEELKSRCSDILSSPSNFDRVINQATLVLEDRIRKKSKLNDLVGVNLVNKAINSDLERSVLQTSDDAEEHEGISHICRGIVLSFRNPTHHKVIGNYTREDALKFCAFVDLLLAIIEKSKLKNAV